MSYIYRETSLPPEVLQDEFVGNLPPVIQKFLAGRGYQDSQEIRGLFTGNIRDFLGNLPMTDSHKAIALLTQALEQGDIMVVYRDYDCDGCSAGAIAVECLATLGAKIFHYGNERTIDGYGICINGINRILELVPDVKLLMTVDNGIVAHEAIAYAKSKGLTVIVTDHHEMGETLPPADAVVDPKRHDEINSFHELCGAGVIFKLLLELYQTLGQDLSPVLRCIDIVAMATVGDIVPLVGENRILVKEGLRAINAGIRPFFREVMKQQDIKTITADSELAFRIVPMINAPSRMMGNVNTAVEALLGVEGPMLTEQVAYLKSINDKRKLETEKVQRQAAKELEVQGIDPETSPVILLSCGEIPDGLVGLVAGRMMNTYYKIVGIFHENAEGHMKGSFRGIDGFHVKEALDKISTGVLLQYGGHAKAAGLSLDKKMFPQFAQEFTALVQEAFPQGSGDAPVYVDVSLHEEDCTVELVELFQSLAPFGEGFRPPLLELSMPDFKVNFMGNDKQHVAYQGLGGMRAIHWRHGDKERKSPHASELFHGNLSLNHWNSRVSVQFLCQ